MNLSSIFEQLEVPPSNVAGRAWDSGVRRVRRRRVALTSIGAAAVVSVVTFASLRAPSAPPPPTPEPDEPANQGLTLTRADGSATTFLEAEVECTTEAGPLMVVLTAGDRNAGPFLRIEGGVDTLDKELTVNLPYSRGFDSPDNFLIFAGDRSADLEASSATEESSGRATVTSTCTGAPAMDISLDGTLASEFFQGEAVTISGSLQASGVAVENESPTPITGAVTAPKLSSADWERLLDSAASVSRGSANSADLSTRPLDHAVLAIGDPEDSAGVLVLGEDGWWRRVDVAPLEPVRDDSGYLSPVLRVTSLSPQGSRLALPQPGGLVIVNLADASFARYDTPGALNDYAIWTDDRHILFGDSSKPSGMIATLGATKLEPATVGSQTYFLPDGTGLTWTAAKAELSTMYSWDDFGVVPTRVLNDGNVNNAAPIASERLAVGQTAINSRAGLVAVDRGTGDALAYQPVSSEKGDASLLLGWSDGLPLIGLRRSLDLSDQTTVVARWDFQNQRFEPIVTLDSPTVSWGRGWRTLQADN